MNKIFVLIVCFFYLLYTIIRIKIEKISLTKEPLDDYIKKFNNIRKVDRFILKILTLIEILILFLIIFERNIIIKFNFISSIYLKLSGVLISVIGLFFICYSSFILNGEYSSIIEVKKEHKLIKKGPYKYIRHPIYLGFILFHLGVSFILSNYIVYLIWLGGLTLLLLYRIPKEEKILTQYLRDEYLVYKKNTGLFIPKINLNKSLNKMKKGIKVIEEKT